VTSKGPLFSSAQVKNVVVHVDVAYDATDPPKVVFGVFVNLLNALGITFDKLTNRAGLHGKFQCD
jgi:hypothetical protein